MVSPSIFSFGSYFTSIVSCLLITMIGCHMIRNRQHVIYRDLRLLILMLVISSVRLAFPVNMPFSISIYSSRILPALVDWLFIEIPVRHLMVYQCLGIVAIIISLMLIVATIVRYTRFYSLIRVASRSSKELDRLLAAIDSSAAGLHARYISANHSPFIIGFIRPLIIIPAALYSDHELELVLRHELIHYHERDSFLKLLLEFLTCIFWWNPLIYFIRHHVNGSLELSNDIRLTDSLAAGDRIDYAQCIVKTARHTISAHDSFSIPFAATNEGNIDTRVRTILSRNDCTVSDSKVSRDIRWALLALPLIVLLSFTIIPEPWGVDPEAAATSFSLEYDLNMNPENSFLLDNGDYYTLYIDGRKLFDIHSLDEEFEKIRIFSTIEEASQAMGITIGEDYEFNEQGIPQ